MEMEEIVVFGGSFNPPHNGHLHIIKEVAKRGSNILVIPCIKHAFNKELAPFKHRVEMCRLLSKGCYAARTLDIEGKLGLSGYTIDTLRALPYENLRLIIGADILAETDKWKSWDEVKNIAPPLVVAREGFDDEGRAAILPAPKISSTQVRERVSQGLSIKALVPEKIAEYIKEKGLYSG